MQKLEDIKLMDDLSDKIDNDDFMSRMFNDDQDEDIIGKEMRIA